MNTANLKKRLSFIIWAVPLAWIVVNSPVSLFSFLPDTFVELKKSDFTLGRFLASLLVILAAGEYFNMMKKKFGKNCFYLLYIWLLYKIVAYFLPAIQLPGNVDGYLLILLGVIETFVWGNSTGDKRWKRVTLAIGGTYFFYTALYGMLDLYSPVILTVFSNVPRESTWLGHIDVIIIISSMFLCDSAAYFVGSTMGKTTFNTISPKKTLEGCGAGLIMSMIVMGIGWYFFADEKYSLIFGLVLGLCIGVIAQAGDLFASMMKRYFDVKDSSHLIPGHGGILDRFDSLFFTLPVIHIVVTIFHKVIG